MFGEGLRPCRSARPSGLPYPSSAFASRQFGLTPFGAGLRPRRSVRPSGLPYPSPAFASRQFGSRRHAPKPKDITSAAMVDEGMGRSAADRARIQSEPAHPGDKPRAGFETFREGEPPCEPSANAGSDGASPSPRQCCRSRRARHTPERQRGSPRVARGGGMRPLAGASGWYCRSRSSQDGSAWSLVLAAKRVHSQIAAFAAGL